MTDNTTNTYPPELKIDYDRTEPAGLRKVKDVPKMMKQGNNWVERRDGTTKRVAQSVNHVHIVLRYADAYKDPTSKKFPVYNFGAGPTVSINWRFFIVGPVATEADGTKLTRSELPVEVSWSDRTTDAWAYDMMTRIINETLQKHPNTKITDHVFEFGKKEGTTPAGSFYFKNIGTLAQLYPAIQLPAAPQPGQGTGSRERQKGPSAAVLNSLPDGAKLPGGTRQAATPAMPTTVAPTYVGTTTPAGGPSFDDLAPPTTQATGAFQPTPEEIKIAEIMLERLQNQGQTLRGVCEQRNIDPYVVLFNTFTKGQARDPATNASLATTPERADFIAKNPSVVGIQL